MKKEEATTESTEVEETIAVEKNVMDEYGCIIKPIGEIITTPMLEDKSEESDAETAEEKAKE